MIMLFEQEEAVKRYGNRMKSEGRSEGKIEGRIEGKVAAYAEMIADGTLTDEKAAEKLEMTVQAFRKAVEALKVTV